MCTVTFIPAKDKIFITSNRDEKAWRGRAIVPQFYQHNNYRLVYPKDADKGGTWIAINENGNVAVLLNGAFVKHEPDPRFTKSRGIIFSEIIESENPVDTFNTINLDATEPFTLVMYADDSLYELRWDGYKKFQTEKDKSQPHIWSSATLYAKDIVDRRSSWFNEWLKNNAAPSAKDILHFHLFGGDGDTHNDIRMNRDGKVFTVSVTNIEITASAAIMRYMDMQDETLHTENISFKQTAETQATG